jgi:arabinofuranosyltransferase
LFNNGKEWLDLDDACFTFRVVNNVLNGEGLVYNSGDRVQVYTHPLWLFLLVGICFFTREFFYTTIILSLLISSLAVWIVSFKLSNNQKMECVGLIGITLSQAFMDYTTGGLENPLLYLIVGVFFMIYLQERNSLKKLFLLALFSGLGMCTRLDLFWLFLPPLFYTFCKVSPKLKGVKLSILGLLPIILWELFSLFYYGFPFPNTVYAKVFYTGIPRPEIIYQGYVFLLDHIIENPITVVIIIVGIVLSYTLKKENLLPIGISILFYIGSIIWVGGCFMRGRFLGVPFLIAMIVVMQWKVENITKYIAFLVVVLITGVLSHSSPLHSNTKYLKEKYKWRGKKDWKYGRSWAYWRYIGMEPSGIADERGFYIFQRLWINN